MISQLLIMAVLATSESPEMPPDSVLVPLLAPISADSVHGQDVRAIERAQPEAGSLGRVYSGWKLSGLLVRGLPGDIASELRRGLALSGQTRWLFFRKRPDFSPELLAADVDRARLFLVRDGYPWAQVTPKLTPNVQRQFVGVALEVVPGARLQVAANHTQAVPPELQPRADRLLRLARNESFQDTRVEQRIARLLSLLQEQGYARAKVTTRVSRVDSTHVEVMFLVEAGPTYHFADQVMDGVPDNLAVAVRKTIDIGRGERYAPSKLHRAEDGLRALDLFRRVDVSTVDAGADSLDVHGKLAERARRTVRLGAGYYTDNAATVTAQWKHRNLFGGGRGASLDAAYSRHLQTAGLTFWKPVLFRTRTRGSLAFGVRREAEDLYLLRSASVEIAGTYLDPPHVTLRPAITLSRIQITSDVPIDSVFKTPPTSLLTLGGRGSVSHLNDAIDPSRGTLVWANLEFGLPNFGLEHNYVLAEAEGLAYRPLTPRALLAGRLHAGAGFGVGNALGLLPNKRFYGGGATSMRGYRRRQLGPLDDFFRPIGGIALFESSLEVRFPVIGDLQGAAFVDAGNVWSSRDEFLRNLAVAVGPGLILKTPVGPARFDVGYLTTAPEPHQPRSAFHVQVGHAF